MMQLHDFVSVEPWEHQQQAFEFLRMKNYGALFAGMGTGKTLVQIGLIGASEPGHWLIVCPLAMVETWAREIRKFARYDVEAIPLTGPIKDRVELLKPFYSDPNAPDRAVYITNYESLVQTKMWDAVLRHPWVGIVLDESHRIKSPSAKVTQKLTSLGQYAKYRNILTGTPAADKPTDVFAQYRFLNENILGRHYNAFRDRYTVGEERLNRSNGGRYYEVHGYQNLEELNERIYQHAFRVTNEVLDLPETTDTRIVVKLEPKTQRIYNRMLRDSLVDLGDDEFTSASNVLARLLRLQQITSGFLPPDELAGQDKKPIEVLSTEKRDALVSLFEDIGPEPVVVFYRFSHDAESIREACIEGHRRFYELSGRRNQLDAWKEDGTPDAVIAIQIRAGGAGISTVKASKVVYFSNSYSLTDWEQSRARSHRPGQTNPVSYYTLVAKDTIDEVIEEALESKQDTVRYLIDGLRRQYG